ncbi:YkvA family protein [Candidatus Leptofilum sp.]|uniref:YkvA family protein n=1 Tax=Candidatus Leptofilum sp. TaxID=3241576 RepID=UPI003B5CD018
MDEKEKKSPMNIEAIAGKRTDPGFFREVWQQARLVYYLLRDPEVPFYLKLLPFTAVLYLLWPVDLLPDVLLGLGQLDDLTALLVSSKVFIEMAPPHLVAQHMDRIRAVDGYDAMDSVNEKIIIDPQPAEKEKDQA